MASSWNKILQRWHLSKGDVFVLWVGFCISVANVFQGFDTGIISVILSDKRFTGYFHFTAPQSGAFAATINVGTCLANLGIMAWVTGNLGRRWGFTIGSLTLMIGVLLQVCAVDLAMLLVGRIIAGIGCGITGCTLSVYLSEITPARLRGAAVSYVQLSYNLGVMVAYWVGLGTTKFHGNASWRGGNALQFLFGILLIIAAWSCPESPRFLVQHRNDKERALRALMRLRRLPPEDPVVINELEDIVATTEFNKAHGERTSFLDFIRVKGLFVRVLYGMGSMALGQISGVGALMIYGVIIFESFGYSGRTQSLLINGVGGVLQFLSVFVSIFTVDRAGRRKVMLSASMTQICCYLIIASLLMRWPQAQNTGAAVVMVICVYLIQMAYCAGTGPVAWIYASEIFPQEQRDRGVSLSQFGQQAVLLALNQAWPVMVANMGHLCYWVLFGINSVAWIIVYILWPETKGVPLESMGRIFGEIDTRVVARQEILGEGQVDEKAEAEAASSSESPSSPSVGSEKSLSSEPSAGAARKVARPDSGESQVV